MDVSAAIKGRRSVRSYKDQEVESNKIEKVLEAGRLSPSANNRQEWEFIVVKNAETKKKLARIEKMALRVITRFLEGIQLSVRSEDDHGFSR
ncbi:MAG: putative dehydrogenase [Acidobacteria bacterium]|nr:putative dehydrogenase [Acidobacteriota bacterium]